MIFISVYDNIAVHLHIAIDKYLKGHNDRNTKMEILKKTKGEYKKSSGYSLDEETRELIRELAWMRRMSASQWIRTIAVEEAARVGYKPEQK